MRIRVSGSRAHRVWKCPASAVLPQVESVVSTPAQGKGKHVHRFLERARITERQQALAEAPPELRPLLECLDLDQLPTHVATEVTLAWDWKNNRGRELGRNLDRQYMTPGFLESIGVAPLGPTEHPVTVDVLGVEERNGIRVGLVGDYKTGHTRHPSPDKYGQTMLGAIAARDVYRLEEVVVDLYYIDDDGEHYPVRRRVDAWDLDAFAGSWARSCALLDEYEALVESGVNPNTVEGPHCDWCPAYKSCPAKLALVSRLPVAVDDLRTGTMTRARAASAWLVLEAMSDLIATMKKEITGMACAEPIELPDGRVIGPHERTERKLDPKVAIRILRERYGEEAVSEAVRQTISLDALRDAVAARRDPKEKISTKDGTGALDRILKEIESAKGLERRTTESVSPYMPKKKRI